MSFWYVSAVILILSAVSVDHGSVKAEPGSIEQWLMKTPVSQCGGHVGRFIPARAGNTLIVGQS